MSRVHGDVSSSFREKDGTLVEYFRGDEVKDKHVKLLDDWGALVPEGEEHFTPEQRMERALNPELFEAREAPAPPEAGPAGGTGDRITGSYDSSEHTAPQLLAEIEARRTAGRTIEVTGTGSGGNVLRGDLESALTADDAA